MRCTRHFASSYSRSIHIALHKAERRVCVSNQTTHIISMHSRFTMAPKIDKELQEIASASARVVQFALFGHPAQVPRGMSVQCDVIGVPLVPEPVNYVATTRLRPGAVLTLSTETNGRVDHMLCSHVAQDVWLACCRSEAWHMDPQSLMQSDLTVVKDMSVVAPEAAAEVARKRLRRTEMLRGLIAQRPFQTDTILAIAHWKAERLRAYKNQCPTQYEFPVSSFAKSVWHWPATISNVGMQQLWIRWRCGTKVTLQRALLKNILSRKVVPDPLHFEIGQMHMPCRTEQSDDTKSRNEVAIKY